MKRRLVWLFPLILLVPWAPNAFGHRLDEYLQATLVTIEPGRILLQINLTPGVSVADKVIAMLDRNRDGVISTNEETAYGEQLKRDLTITLDGHKLKPQLTGCDFPAPLDLRTGWGFVQLEYEMKLKPLTVGAHRVVIRNRHWPKMSAYLCNATLPKNKSIQVTQQKRNENQSEGEIRFVVSE